MNGARRNRRAKPSIPDNPYAADFLADTVVTVVPGADLRQIIDAVNAHPDVLALKVAAHGRAEHEAVIGSTAKLVRRTVYAAAYAADAPPF